MALVKMYKRIAAFLTAAAMTIAALPVFNMPTVYAASSIAEKYFYNQLTDKVEGAKVFYNAMEKMEKDGVFKRGESFDLVANGFLTSDEAEAYGTTELLRLYGVARDAFCADHADLFYVDFSYLTLRVNTDESGNYHVYLGTGRSDSYYTEGFETEEQVNAAVKEYEAAVDAVVKMANEVEPKNGRNLVAEKVKAVHDYIVYHTSYRLENACKPANIGFIRTAYGSLVKGEAVCEGYSRALKTVLDRLGIPCVLVYGVFMHKQNTPELHMWCEVQIDGAWYGVDATMDDPIGDKGTTPGTDGYENQIYLLVGNLTLSVHHQASGIMSPVEYEFKYPELNDDDFNVKLVSSYGDLTVKFKEDGELEGTEAGTFYVSYKNMGVIEAEKHGIYLIMRTRKYLEDTDQWKVDNVWAYLTSDFSSDFKDWDFGTFTAFPLPQVSYAEFAVTTVPPPYQSGIPDGSYQGDPDDLSQFEAYSGVLYNPNGNYIKPPYIKSTTPALTSTIDGEREYYDVVLEYDEVLVEEEGKKAGVKMTAVNALRYDEEIPSTAADYARISNFSWEGNKVMFRFSPSKMWLDDSTRYTFDITGLVGERSKKPPMSVSYYAIFPKCCPCAYWYAGIDWTLYAKPTLMEDFSPDNFDPTGWTDEEGNEIAKELASRMVLVVSTPSDDQNKEIEAELQNSEAGKGAEILQTFNINLTTCKAQVVKTGQKVKIFLGFPAGYVPGTETMKNSTFKAYHFPKNEKGEITDCEEIECTVTSRGLIIMCNAFSPFAIAKAPAEKDAAKSVVCSVPDGGTATFDGANDTNGSIFFLEKGESKAITITAKKGYVIDSIKVGENYVQLEEKDRYTKEIEVSYGDFGVYDGIVDVQFVAETVYQEEVDRGEVPAEKEPVAAAGVKVSFTFGDDVTVENGVNVRYVEEDELGSALTFAPTVEISADLEYSCQWYKDGEPISGETKAELTIPSVSVSDYGTYELVLTFDAGSETLQRRASVVLKSIKDKDSGSVQQPFIPNVIPSAPSDTSAPDNTDNTSDITDNTVFDGEAATLKDTASGVELIGTFAEGVRLKVTADDVNAGNTRIVYDITLLDSGDNIIQPDGKVTVKIPVPEIWADTKLYVYRVETDGTYTDMNAILENGYMVFVTEHLSKYILTTEKIEVGAEDTDTGKSANDSDTNHNTGVVLVVIPVLVSAAAAVIAVKRRK